MKRLIVILAVAAVVGSFGMVGQAGAGGNSWAAKWCQANWDHPLWQSWYGWKSQGDCVAEWVRRQDFPAKFCQAYWDHPYYQAYYGWNNQGDCVSWFRTWN